MGGEPLAAFLSLAVPAELPQAWVDGFLRGFSRLTRKFAVPLAGGDTAQSLSGVLADVVLLGSVPRGKAILRSGAKLGDDIYVTGKLGAAAAALHHLLKQETRPARGSALRPRTAAALLGDRLFFPQPRLAVGRFLREHALASAMIDISDGLSVSTWRTSAPKAESAPGFRPLPYQSRPEPLPKTRCTAAMNTSCCSPPPPPAMTASPIASPACPFVGWAQLRKRQESGWSMPA